MIVQLFLSIRAESSSRFKPSGRGIWYSSTADLSTIAHANTRSIWRSNRNRAQQTIVWFWHSSTYVGETKSWTLTADDSVVNTRSRCWLFIVYTLKHTHLFISTFHIMCVQMIVLTTLHFLSYLRLLSPAFMFLCHQTIGCYGCHCLRTNVEVPYTYLFEVTVPVCCCCC